MSDTESEYENDYDNNDDYSDDDDDNNVVLPKNNVSNEKVIEFVGTINGKAGWIKCLYCDRYHPNSMHLTGMEYCGHCWSWLNTNQLDLEKAIYTGQNSISEVKQYLKDTFKLHDPTKCTTAECIYNKIISLEKNKKLHIDFCIELGFAKKPEPLNQLNLTNSTNLTNLTNSTNSTNLTNTTNSGTNKIARKSNIKINYKLSHIAI
jgi:hypothetical protein